MNRLRPRDLRFHQAQRQARVAYWEYSVRSGWLHGAGNMAEVLGCESGELPATINEYLQRVVPDERASFCEAMSRARDPANTTGVEFEHHVLAAAGEPPRAMVIRAKGHYRNGKLLRVAGTLQDVSPYRRYDEHLHRAAAAIEHSGDAIVIFDARGAILSANPAFTRITGFMEAEVLGKQLDAVLNRPTGRHDESFYRRILGRLRTFGRWKGELWGCTKGGRDFAMLLTLNEIRDAMGRVSNHVGVFADISRQKQDRARLEQLALHDNLTGLPNRALFLDRAQQALAAAQRNGSQIGLVFIDLDLFKSVNDRYGHAVGDAVLREAGARMHHSMRDCDTVARLGGDEFVVLLNDVVGEHDCISVAERLVQVLMQPYQVQSESVLVGASLGMAVSGVHGSAVDTLLHRADQALYSVKGDSRVRYAVWSPDLDPAPSSDSAMATS